MCRRRHSLSDCYDIIVSSLIISQQKFTNLPPQKVQIFCPRTTHITMLAAQNFQCFAECPTLSVKIYHSMSMISNKILASFRSAAFAQPTSIIKTTTSCSHTPGGAVCGWFPVDTEPWVSGRFPREKPADSADPHHTRYPSFSGPLSE